MEIGFSLLINTWKPPTIHLSLVASPPACPPLHTRPRPSIIFQFFLSRLFLYFFLNGALSLPIYLSPPSLHRPSPRLHFSSTSISPSRWGGRQIDEKVLGQTFLTFFMGFSAFLLCYEASSVVSGYAPLLLLSRLSCVSFSPPPCLYTTLSASTYLLPSLSK